MLWCSCVDAELSVMFCVWWEVGRVSWVFVMRCCCLCCDGTLWLKRLCCVCVVVSVLLWRWCCLGVVVSVLLSRRCCRGAVVSVVFARCCFFCALFSAVVSMTSNPGDFVAVSRRSERCGVCLVSSL